MVLADAILLLAELKVPATALTDLVLDDYDEGNLLLALGVRELDDGRGDYDVVDVVVVAVVLVVPVVIIIPAIAVVVVVIAVASNHDHSSGIKRLNVARV